VLVFAATAQGLMVRPLTHAACCGVDSAVRGSPQGKRKACKGNFRNHEVSFSLHSTPPAPMAWYVR
jgi:hypothetical protein